MLLAHVLAANHAFLLTHPEHILTSQQEANFHHLVEQRSVGQPVAYLIGKREFYDLIFNVNAAVLIPRPETEELVHLILSDNKREGLNVLDIGTGSGILAIAALKLGVKSATGTDNDELALDHAKKNAKLNRSGSALKFAVHAAIGCVESRL